MNRVAFALLALTLAARARAQTPSREEATLIWKVTHPKTGSVAMPIRTLPGVALEFPFGPIISGKNIDLKPKKKRDAELKMIRWDPWTIPAYIKVKRTQTHPLTEKPKIRLLSWRLYARLRNGRIVEAKRGEGGTDSAFTDGTMSTRTDGMRFALTTNVATQKDFNAMIQSLKDGEGFVSQDVPQKPLLWRDVTELWFFEK